MTGDEWYNSSINIASMLGFINGYKDGSVLPNNSITRAEAMAIIGRVLSQKGFSEAISAYDRQNALGSFKDGNTAPAWAEEDVAACIRSGIIKGDGDNRLNLNERLTRAETAVIINRLNELLSR